MMWLRALIVLVAAISTGKSASAMLFAVSAESPFAVEAQYPITLNDAERLKKLIEVRNAHGFPVQQLILNSPGGLLGEGIKLAEIVRSYNITTAVDSRGPCASACFLVFTAGSRKLYTSDAKVGIHSASDQNGADSNAARAATTTMARVAGELGVPSALVGKIVTTLPSDLTWLSKDDLASLPGSKQSSALKLDLASSSSATRQEIGSSPALSFSARSAQTDGEVAGSDGQECMHAAFGRIVDDSGADLNEEYFRACQKAAQGLPKAPSGAVERVKADGLATGLQFGACQWFAYAGKEDYPRIFDNELSAVFSSACSEGWKTARKSKGK
jgi:hypothetical protein